MTNPPNPSDPTGASYGSSVPEESGLGYETTGTGEPTYSSGVGGTDYTTGAGSGYAGSTGYGTGSGVGGDTGYSTTYSDTGSQSTADVAKDEAAGVKDTAVDAGQRVTGVAKDQAGQVVSEAGTQAKNLASRAADEVRGQASTQQQRLAGAVHSVAQELGSMGSASDQPGPMSDLAKQGSQRAGELAHWLENHEPGDLLDELRSFARRRPAAFLGIAAVAGLLAGRLTRGLASQAKDDMTTPSGPSYQTSYPSTYPDTGAYATGAAYPTTSTSSTYGTPSSAYGGSYSGASEGSGVSSTLGSTGTGAGSTYAGGASLIDETSPEGTGSGYGDESDADATRRIYPDSTFTDAGGVEEDNR